VSAFMMNIGVVGIPGAWSTERLAEAVRSEGAQAQILALEACALRLPDRRLFHEGEAVEGLDAAVVKKIGDTADGWVVRERINLLRHLETSGVSVLSPPERLETAVNRYRMTVELARAELPVPQTVVTEDIEEAEGAVIRFGAAVLKPLFTSKGRGMHRLDASADLRRTLEQFRRDGFGPFYLQRFIEHPGRDLGVAVLEGRVVGAYWRVAGPEQWMTTIHSGGRYERAQAPGEALDIAARAANHFGLLFTGVDLMETPDGGWVVLEVSAFGGFRGLLNACGVDAAPLLARALLSRLARISR